MPSTTHLTQDQRSLLADLLHSRLADLKQTMESHLHGLTQAELARQTQLQDADDASQTAGRHEVEAVVSDIDSGEFRAIRDAIDRMKGSGYGLCADCGVAIPFGRLQLEPQALRCTPCQTFHERQSPT